jgi:hypothetical protein
MGGFGRWIGALFLGLTFVGTSGCAALAECMLDGEGGLVGGAVKAGFIAGAVAAAPATLACAPVTVPLGMAMRGEEGLGVVFGPSIVAGAALGAALAVPAAVFSIPVWIAEAIGEAAFRPKGSGCSPIVGGPEPDPEGPCTLPLPPDPVEAPPPVPEVVCRCASCALPEPAPAPAPCAPPSATAAPEPDPALPAEACCSALAIARLLPPHEHGAGLTHALYAALALPAAREEAERLLEEREDALPLLLSGLGDEARGPALARVLLARGDDPGVALGLAGIAARGEAEERARLLARALLLELEARRARERGGR